MYFAFNDGDPAQTEKRKSTGPEVLVLSGADGGDSAVVAGRHCRHCTKISIDIFSVHCINI